MLYRLYGLWQDGGAMYLCKLCPDSETKYSGHLLWGEISVDAVVIASLWSNFVVKSSVILTSKVHG